MKYYELEFRREVSGTVVISVPDKFNLIEIGKYVTGMQSRVYNWQAESESRLNDIVSITPEEAKKHLVQAIKVDTP